MSRTCSCAGDTACRRKRRKVEGRDGVDQNRGKSEKNLRLRISMLSGVACCSSSTIALLTTSTTAFDFFGNSVEEF
jgi:hypothetical protein